MSVAPPHPHTAPAELAPAPPGGGQVVHRSIVALRWLGRLRWMAVVAQALTIFAVSALLDVRVPVMPLLGLVAVIAVTNAAVAAWARRRLAAPAPVVGGVLAVDVLVLTAMLALAGGPYNPFSVLYLVLVTLTALMLGARWAMGIVALASACHAALFFLHRPLEELTHAGHGGGALDVHLQGMWLALTLASAVIAYFVAHLSAELRERDAALALAERAAARADKLASLTTLAAGAAHELATPLGTIAVIAKELERTAGMAPAAIDDARLVRQEVDRCRAILQRMSARAGDTIGELPQVFDVRAALSRVRDELAAEGRRLELGDAYSEDCECPREGFVEVVLGLVQNALAASPPDAAVTASAARDGRWVAVSVRDRGVGIGPEDLAHVGEPFFTTKPAGRGMGLGVFLARTFAERWGGSLELRSELGGGTEVTLRLPRVERGADLE